MRGLVRGGSAAFAAVALAVVAMVAAQPVTTVAVAYASGAPTRAGVSDRQTLNPHHPPLTHPGSGGTTPTRRSTPVLVIGSNQQLLINRDRAAARLGALSWSGCLQAVAISNAKRMAAQGYISHTNGAWRDLACHLGVQGGENVGWWSGGVNDAQLNRMFMASPDHRANIMGPYHYVATAWAVAANGFAYIAVEFN